MCPLLLGKPILSLPMTGQAENVACHKCLRQPNIPRCHNPKDSIKAAGGVVGSSGVGQGGHWGLSDSIILAAMMSH